MKIQEIITNYHQLTSEQSHLIRSACGTFIHATDTPLLKNLNNDSLLSRVKVRFHKRNDQFVEVFNEALMKKYNIANIHQRCIFANGPDSFVPNKSVTPYYVFPIDGYRFLYSRGVKDANEQLRDTMNNLSLELDDADDEASRIMHDLLQYTYESTDLEQGIVEGCEVIVYNIPYYYAINAKQFPIYEQLLSNLKGRSI